MCDLLAGVDRWLCRTQRDVLNQYKSTCATRVETGAVAHHCGATLLAEHKATMERERFNAAKAKAKAEADEEPGANSLSCDSQRAEILCQVTLAEATAKATEWRAAQDAATTMAEAQHLGRPMITVVRSVDHTEDTMNANRDIRTRKKNAQVEAHANAAVVPPAWIHCRKKHDV